MSSLAAVLALAVCAYVPVHGMKINFNIIDQEVNPVMIAIVLAAAVISVLLATFVIMKSRVDGYRPFGNKSGSGYSTSSSDITSSETGSTDRELKSRMERFEKRLEEHKKMLEKKPDDTSSVTDSESAADSGSNKVPWMKM